MAALQTAGTMRAVVRRNYGPPDVLRLEDVPKPELADDGILVRVHATSVNRADWYGVAGRPYVARPMIGLRKPREPLIGGDFAGTVEAVGGEVTDVQPGDDVFGGRSGAFAEYVCSRKGYALKPSTLTFEEAATVPLAAITALQGLRDRGRLQAGQRVLVNGASGGVGTFAVQIAKALGAEVTAVCSTRNVETARSLGADHVLDYTRDDFTRAGQRYDVLFDNAGNRSWVECTRVLEPHGIAVLVGGPMRNRLLGPLARVLRIKLASLVSRRKAVFFIASFNKPDMETIRRLVEDGKLRPVVDRTYALAETAEARRTMGEGHVQGKLVISV